MNIKTVTVVGANGTMGKNAVGIFASFGNAKVYMVGRNVEALQKAADKAVVSVRAESIRNNLVIATFDQLEKYVSQSDLVFESVSENIELKKIVATRIASALKPDAISCTGTSGLSITDIAEIYPENLRKNFYGVHIFNPPYSMPLCELTATKYNDKQTTQNLKEYLQNTLYRTVVETKDSPAFLGNRIGFFFINSAMQAAEKYKDCGGIDYIDELLGPFTGRAMAPLLTADFVGLDVHKAIVDNLYKNTSDYEHNAFVLPTFAEELINKGSKGRKVGIGLYKGKEVFDIANGNYREKHIYNFPLVSKMKSYIHDGEYEQAFKQLIADESQEARIITDFLKRYVEYSVTISEEVCNSLQSADDVMSAGFNWCPPLALYHILRQCGFQFNLNIDLPESQYDYRQFFKAK